MLKEIEERRSIRKYIDKPVEEEKIMEIIESGRLAPSGSNTQPWHFIIVREEENRKKIIEASHKQKWMLTAPVIIVCVSDIRSRLDENLEISLNEDSPEIELKQIIRDTAMATENMVLQAKNLGLDTCYVAWFTQEEIRPVLNIPEDKYVLSVLTLGYSDEKPNMRPRKSLKDIIHMEKW
ncbi:nitroreductase [Clostridium acetobutylicum]|uniref:Nitroreductase family protein n=1 Tax=Clostridium acetobutylicum (strain ATCC 824 / DSM 792 / JCM 1419 / IAM 19013 / LMG 5710 / NBRC 13948 / NRRL B-527 / VKM B-1787 / 2291 / W) TaxID=272562 RepID=Q97J68_CLOAB|nr:MULTISPECIES: nitroreductase family protein [Clostridium]AAK79386.1 Nitroreductase family protein [Clostridium acetobutylicum ATCC 824]ADZ20471.1 Nitroreductase family protein [Clostridium acetobutylicum EA 2018]AEI33810.1 nitroreductase family protein [Clostridium acetobutylicum DSM 1731]AWV81365.1 nitroreductase [Clostridium acetobutylicum]KHD36161.1 nitroreductase [Clostridium acetobutylicum]